jgi:hydroxymethylglutaryl-CoA reductase
MSRFMPHLPGAELVEQGVRDLERGVETVESLLVSIGAPRLRALGLAVAAPIDETELRLYRRLAAEHGAAAHSRYNALVRRLVSYQRAATCAK